MRAGLYTARAGRLTANDADLLGRLLLVVREVHRAIRRAVWRVGHFICFVVGTSLASSSCWAAPREVVPPPAEDLAGVNLCLLWHQLRNRSGRVMWPEPTLGKLSCSEGAGSQNKFQPHNVLRRRDDVCANPSWACRPSLVALSHTHKMAGASVQACLCRLSSGAERHGADAFECASASSHPWLPSRISRGSPAAAPPWHRRLGQTPYHPARPAPAEAPGDVGRGLRRGPQALQRGQPARQNDAPLLRAVCRFKRVRRGDGRRPRLADI